jgi:hypothetical protein
VVSSPEGTAEWVRYRPSLWDLSPRASTPSVETGVETLGYSRRSLQDAWHLDIPVCRVSDIPVAGFDQYSSVEGFTPCPN